MKFSARLTEILAARSMNKSDLSRALNVTPQAAGQWALGGHGPTVARLQKIAAALDVPPADLLMPPGSPISGDGTVLGYWVRDQFVDSPDQPRQLDTPGQASQHVKLLQMWDLLSERDRGIVVQMLQTMLLDRITSKRCEIDNHSNTDLTFINKP